jgi:hypothetical protein
MNDLLLRMNLEISLNFSSQEELFLNEQKILSKASILTVEFIYLSLWPEEFSDVSWTCGTPRSSKWLFKLIQRDAESRGNNARSSY